MATYLPGSTDFIAQIQPFQPDLNFYKGVMDTKESQYKQGYDKISNIYGQLLNSELTRGINNERRSKFFNQINTDIQRLAGVDLSLEENVEAAYNVFQPLINDKNIIKDMAWTKNFNREMGRSEYFRKCINEKECGGKWWEGGVRALQYQKMDFAKSSDEQALAFANAQYTPYINVTKMATELAKDMGFNVQTVSWSPDGKYIVTTKGGQQMTMDLANYFASVYGNDPNVQQYYKTQAYLNRKDFVFSNVSQYGSEDAAESYYLTNQLAEIEKIESQRKQDTEDQLYQINLKKGILEEKDQTTGYDPEHDNTLLTLYQQLSQEGSATENVLNQQENTLGYIDRETLMGSDLDTLRWRVDQAVAGSLLNNDLFNAADSYASLNFEQDIKADPYAQASFEHGLAMSRLAAEYDYKMKFKQFETAMDMVKGSYGGKGKKGQMNPFMMGGLSDYHQGPNTAYQNAKNDIYQEQMQEVESYTMGTQQLSGEYLWNSYKELTNIIQTQPNSQKAILAKQALSDIIGADKLKMAMSNGYIDKNFNIVDPEQFSFFVKSDEKGLMSRTDKVLTDNALLLFDTPDQMQRVNNLNAMKYQYQELSQLKEIYDNDQRQRMDNVKNGLITANYSEVREKNWFERSTDRVANWVERNIPFGGTVKGWAGMKKGEDGKYALVGQGVRDQIGAMLFGDNKNERMQDIQSVFAPDGIHFISKEDYIAKTRADYMKNSSYWGRTEDTGASWGTFLGRNFIPGGVGLIWNIADAFHVSDAEVDTYLGERYDDAVKIFKNEFNSGKVTGYPQGTHTYAGNMEATVDPADWQSEPFQDYVSIMNNYFDMQDQPGVKVLQGWNHSGSKYNDAGSDRTAVSLMENVFNDMIYNEYDFKDKDRPVVNMINQRIAAENSDLTAYTFEVDPQWLATLSGTEKKKGPYAYMFDKEGQIKGSQNIFTVYIPKDYATNSYFQKTEKGPYQSLFDEKGQVNLNMGDNGNVTVKQEGNRIYTTGFYNAYDPVSGTYEQIPVNQGGPIELDPGANIDEIMNKWRGLYQQLAQQNTNNKMIYGYNNPKKKNILNQ